jgi:uncharacterized membrane protein YecN with MAPEG domain
MHPNLFPVTAPYAAILGLLAAALTVRVIVNRVRLGVDIGDGGVTALTQAIRAHANFAEHVPIALLLILIAEAAGAPAMALHGLAAALVIARLASAYGLSTSVKPTPGRTAGAGMTVLIIVLASLLVLYKAVTGVPV